MASSAELAGDVGATSSANPASVVTTGVAFSEKCRDSVVIPSDCVCDYDEIAEVASSVELYGNVTVSVAPTADMDSVFTAGASSVEDYQERNVLPSGIGRSPADTDESIVELEAIVVGAVGTGAPWFLIGWAEGTKVEFMIDTGW